MSPLRPRLGTYVTIGGVEYPADSHPAGGTVTIFARAPGNPAPDLLAAGPEPGLWVGDVRTADCERVVSVTTRAYWHGELCQVMSVDTAGNAVIYHLDGNKAKSATLGFRSLEPGTYARAVPVADLEGYHEFQSDLLFDEWARA